MIFFNEFIQITAADILLLSIVTFFFISGLGYKIQADRKAKKTRLSIQSKKSSLEQLTNQERGLKIELQGLMQKQKENMKEIDRLKKARTAMGRMPFELEKELEKLMAWCDDRNISADFKRGLASTPQGRPHP